MILEELNFLLSPLSNLNGIGEKTLQDYIRLLTKKRTLTGEHLKVLNLLLHLPDKIIKRKIVSDIKNIDNGDIIIAKIKVIALNPPTKIKQPYTITCYLGMNFINIVYYKYFEDFIKNRFVIDKEIYVSGKVDIYNSQIQIVHPDYITNNLDEIPKLEPIYPLTYNIYNKNLIKNIDFILNNCPDLPEWIDEEILKKNDWVNWKESLINLHKPNSFFDLKNNKYRKRLAFDEILAQQLALAIVKTNSIKNNEKQAIIKDKLILKDKFLNEILPFNLTEDQKTAIREIENDTFSSKRMIRLLQGDVGSGKTIVAFVSMLNYIEKEKQCVLMVPTSILAMQHYENLKVFCDKLNIKIDILTGKIKGKKRNNVLNNLKNGETNILVGTHALIEDNVEFKDLAFTVIDEQHRFGVEQRITLINKNDNTDILAMSATPIPRTLALTIYNEMLLTIIKEKPQNRKKIITSIVTIDKYYNLIDRIKEKIKIGEKVYWICPLVEESENMDLTDVKNKYDEFCEIFGTENIAFIHGKMKEKEKDKIMEEFCNNNQKKILISTTVIEVGIDVKDATIIVIDHPERFGLSQLHQLRGRVGRGDKQSYCILLCDYKNCGKNTIRRLNIMRSTDNGFTIAEEDLKMRGVGEVMGIKQSGQQDYLIADLDKDYGLMEQAMFLVQNICKKGDFKNYKLLLYLFGYMNLLKKEILN